MGSVDDWFVSGSRQVFFDFNVRFDGGILCGAYPVGAPKSAWGLGSAVCAVSSDRNGGGGMFLRKTAKGYMTVEASFIITWTIFLFVLLIYLSFYSYDKCVLFQDAYAVCFRGSIQKKEEQVVSYINAHIKEQFGSKYFGVGQVQGRVDRDGNTTSVEGECQVKVPVRQLFTLYDKEGWKISTRARAQIINPTKVIRRCRLVGNILKE